MSVAPARLAVLLARTEDRLLELATAEANRPVGTPSRGPGYRARVAATYCHRVNLPAGTVPTTS